jgi:hypothetical protein
MVVRHGVARRLLCSAKRCGCAGEQQYDKSFHGLGGDVVLCVRKSKSGSSVVGFAGVVVFLLFA